MGRKEGSKNITLTIKRLIISEALKKPPKPRRALAIELMDKIERMGEVVPTEETIERLISEARNHEPNPLDEPWRMLDIVKYPISPDTLPIVLEVWGDQVVLQAQISIREALWIARLYHIFKEAQIDLFELPPWRFLKGELADHMKDYYSKHSRLLLIITVTFFARTYALREITLELTNKKQHEKSEDMWADWLEDGYLHWALTGSEEVYKTCELKFHELFPGGIPLKDETKDKIEKASSELLRVMKKKKALEAQLKEKEAQNERPHNKER